MSNNEQVDDENQEDEEEMNQRMQNKKAQKKKKKQQQAMKKKQELDEQRKIFGDTSLLWNPRKLDNSRWQGISSWADLKGELKWHQIKENQNIPVDLLFSEEEVVPEMRNQAQKETRSEEEKTKEAENFQAVKDLRKAGETARILRHQVQSYLKDGTNLQDFSLKAEEVVHKVVGYNPENMVKRGFANPLAFNMNNGVSYNVLLEQKGLTYKKGDVCNVEQAINYNGYIAANSFSLCEDPKQENLIKASKEAVEVGIKNISIDARCNEVAEKMLEVVKSQECEHEGEKETVVPVTNLCGQKMNRQRIDDEKTLWFTREQLNKVKSDKFAEGESWSIRMGVCVGGKGEAKHEGDQTIFGHKMQHQPTKSIRIKNAQKLFTHIESNYKNMQGSLRQLEAVEMKNALLLRNLQDLNLIDLHSPLAEKTGAKCAVFEHTVQVKPYSGVEVITAGDDF